jgi:hypothetical protein
MNKYLKDAIRDLSDRSETLKRRIAVRKKEHKEHADLDIQLLAVTMKLSRAERRWIIRQNS